MIIDRNAAAVKVLSFPDYIKKLPTQWLFEHFLSSGGSSRQVLSSTVVNERVRQFSEPARLAELFASLDTETQTRCALTYLAGTTGFLAPKEGDVRADALAATFLVYAAQSGAGEVRYFGFNEFEKHLCPLFAARLAAEAPARGKVERVPARHGNCINDITVTATLAAQGELEKKKQGGLTRNSLARLARLIHETSSDPGHECITGLLTAYCVHAGIVHETPEAFLPIDNGLEAWLKGDSGARMQDIVGFTVRYAGGWRTDLLAEMAKTAGSGWLSCALFPPPARAAAIQTLQVLAWAGLCALSRTASDGVVFGGLSEQDQPEGETSGAAKTGGLVLLPDFSAVIPPGVLPEDLYRFGKIGTFQSLDRVYKGKINRTIINDSLAAGLDGQSVLGWLGEWGASPNMLATVQEWIREFNRLYLSTGMVLVTADEKVTRQVASFGLLRDCLEPVPSHAVFKIKPGAEERVRGFLGQMGFDFRMPGRVPVCPGDSEAGTVVPVIAWEPIVSFDESPAPEQLALRGKKYGAGLKKLDLNEIMHIIDYSILTGTMLVLDYSGSPLVKKGEYTVSPLACSRGTDPMLDARLKNGTKKQFHIRKIGKIGVGIV